VKTPEFIVRYRIITVAIALLIIVLVALGAVGIGPFSVLLGPAAPKINI
jgi:hypothetical protein